MKALLCFLACCIWVLAIAAGPCFGQSTSRQAAAYELTDVRYHVQGITRWWALEKVLDLPIGTLFASRAELDRVVADRTQLLINERTLDSARIDVSTEQRTGQPEAVILDVHVRDSWNIIGMPYFRYDSNDGLLLSLRGRDYNFFGTMQPLRINLDYAYTEDHENEWSIDGKFTLPFRFAGHEWRWTLSGDFEYSDGYSGFETETALAIDFPLWPKVWTLEASQGYRLLRHDNDTYDDDYYYSSGLSFGSVIGLGIELPVFRELKYSPSVYVDVNYKDQGELSPEYGGVRPGFKHSLSAGRVDWIGNFRNGARFSLDNSYTYNLRDELWERDVTGELAGFLAADPFGFSARIYSFYKLDEVETDDAADAIRGVLDDRMAGNVGVFWNSDITLKVMTIGKLLEGQGSIFFDAAVVTDTHRAFDPDTDFKLGVGIEAIGFPLFARAFYIRVSLGFDLLDVIRTRAIGGDYKREIFIGFGHHY